VVGCPVEDAFGGVIGAVVGAEGGEVDDQGEGFGSLGEAALRGDGGSGDDA